MENFLQLVNIIKTLRGPNGCPWDKEQTHLSITNHLIEESYELVEAIKDKNPQHIKEELGDVLLQVLLHSQIADDENHFNIDDVIKDLNEKLIRRHPHVFSDEEASNSSDVEKNWDLIKAKEKKHHAEGSILNSIPKSLPSLFEAYKIGKKANKVGFDWNDKDPCLDKISEEMEELKEALENKNHQEISEELGDVLFSLTNFARHLKINPEEALKNTNQKFRDRFKFIENELAKLNKNWQDYNLDELDQLWDKAKKAKLK
jgi:tetrapyrrole methylase family protein/MazG family protein